MRKIPMRALLTIAIISLGMTVAAAENAQSGDPEVFDTWPELAELTASRGANGDQMGISISINGDTVVVGAQNATVNGHVGQGAAYVFVKPTNGWGNMTQTAKLTASDGKAGDGFGGSVYICWRHDCGWELQPERHVQRSRQSLRLPQAPERVENDLKIQSRVNCIGWIGR